MEVAVVLRYEFPAALFELPVQAIDWEGSSPSPCPNARMPPSWPRRTSRCSRRWLPDRWQPRIPGRSASASVSSRPAQPFSTFTARCGPRARGGARRDVRRKLPAETKLALRPKDCDVIVVDQWETAAPRMWRRRPHLPDRESTRESSRDPLPSPKLSCGARRLSRVDRCSGSL